MKSSVLGWIAMGLIEFGVGWYAGWSMRGDVRPSDMLGQPDGACYKIAAMGWRYGSIKAQEADSLRRELFIVKGIQP